LLVFEVTVKNWHCEMKLPIRETVYFPHPLTPTIKLCDLGCRRVRQMRKI